MDISGLQELELETIENAIAMETIDTNIIREIKLFIPKLMPLCQKDIPKEQRLLINRNSLLNDKKSIPNYVNYITYLTNYIVIPLSDKFSNKIINEGDNLLVLLPNKNFKEMMVIDI